MKDIINKIIGKTKEKVIEVQKELTASIEPVCKYSEEEYNGYKIIIEPPNEINVLTRVIVTTQHGTHIKEWVLGDKGIKLAKEFIDNGI
jgi:hypothetical protein